MPKALCGGKRPLQIGPLEIPCYVLEEGSADRDEDRRVITASGLQAAIGMGAGDVQTRLLGLVARFAGKSTAAKDLTLRLESPVEFILPGGGLGRGYSAQVLLDLCDVILQARQEGRVTERYAHIAGQAEVVIRAFANVGIVALIDEATDYQKVRRRLALAEILDRYLSDRLNTWTKTFPDDYYTQMFRLKGWDFAKLQAGDGKPGEVGRITREVVYRRLAPGMVEELERQNPCVVPGRRQFKHHQWLTSDMGHPALREHLAKIITTMKLSKDWLDFERKIAKVLPKPTEQGWFDDFFREDDAS